MKPATPQLLYVGYHAPQSSWRLRDQDHDHHELIVVVGGRQSVAVQSVTFTAEINDVIWFPVNARHTEQADPNDPVRAYFIGFIWPELLVPNRLHLVDVDGRITQLTTWLHSEREADPSLSCPVAHAFLRAMIAEYNRLATKPADPLVDKVRQFMRRHLHQKLSLDQLAAIAGLSRFHFIRRYRGLTGRTPMADLRLIRLQAARDQLLTTNLPLKEIAPGVGLCDEYHLSRLFRRHLGYSPSQLRQRRGR